MPQLLLLLLLLCPANADEEDKQADPLEAEAPWLSLGAPVDLPSALDPSVGPIPETAGRPVPEASEPEEAVVPAPVRRVEDKRFRGRVFARPRLAFVALDPSWALVAGFVAGHQWWSLREGTLSPVGETQLVIGAPIGGLAGHEVGLTSTAGAWWGPVGLLAGPSVRWDRLQYGSLGLPSAWTLGPTLRVAARLGRMTPWLTAAPHWILEGRAGLDAPWDELELGGGLELVGRPFAWRLGGSWRDTASGERWEAVVGLHWRLL